MNFEKWLSKYMNKGVTLFDEKSGVTFLNGTKTKDPYFVAIAATETDADDFDTPEYSYLKEVADMRKHQLSKKYPILIFLFDIWFLLFNAIDDGIVIPLWNPRNKFCPIAFCIAYQRFVNKLSMHSFHRWFVFYTRFALGISKINWANPKYIESLPITQ